jgi:putative spermidine/putrescine transport system permease protein
MRARWELALVPSLLISAALLIASQALFLTGSLHRDLGMGRFDQALGLDNFVEIFGDSYYLHSFLLSVTMSAAATVATIVVAFPTAYFIARMQSRLSALLLAAVIASSFVTIVIKVLGLLLIFASNGPLNRLLEWLGLIHEPVTVLGTWPGVILGLMYYTLGFAVLLFYSIVVTVPRSWEEAAEIHGASRWQVMRRVVLPLCLPGLAAGALIVFNVSMGGFSSTALLGAGKVLTVPILIQRTVLLETDYGLGAAISILLLLAVLAINTASAALVARTRREILV